MSATFTFRKAYSGVVGGVRHVFEEAEQLFDRELAAKIELDQPGTLLMGASPTVANGTDPEKPTIEAVDPAPVDAPHLAPEPAPEAPVAESVNDDGVPNLAHAPVEDASK